jgi:enamine deaminase RidA (YjgF/YER057c/UK114 family)
MRLTLPWAAESRKERRVPDHFEVVHTPAYDPSLNMPYVPAIKVRSGRLVFVAGTTAAPVYHQHPHRPEDFAGIPEDAAEQARLTMEELSRVLAAAGGSLQDVVQVTRFIRDVQANQDAINRVINSYFGEHRPTSTTVEVVRMATDPRLKLEIAAIAVVPD